MTFNKRNRWRFTDKVDQVINGVKWPVAAITVFFLPSSFQACWPAIQSFMRSGNFMPFLIGIACFLLVKKMIRRTPLWTLLWVFEHESIHLLFGLLCLKLPNRWSVTRKGGCVGFDRGFNWMITLAPYVFPLIPFLAFVCFQLLTTCVELDAWMLPAVMGFATAMHVAFTWVESHRRQPDIKRLGAVFSLLVVPTMHCVFLGIVLALSSSSATRPFESIATQLMHIGLDGLQAWGAMNSDG